MTYHATSNSAPTTVTYDIRVWDDNDPDVAWDFKVDDVLLDSGTGNVSRSFTQSYDLPGKHTAVLTAFDGTTTTRRSLTLVFP